MNQEEINALAREYAEWVTIPKSGDFPNCLLNEANRLIADDMERILQWLLRRFCLVERSRIKEEYQKALTQIQDGKELGIHVLVFHGTSKSELLESIFPELKKK